MQHRHMLEIEVEWDFGCYHCGNPLPTLTLKIRRQILMAHAWFGIAEAKRLQIARGVVKSGADFPIPEYICVLAGLCR